MEVHLRTLTPLWTGGVDQRSDRLHETGLIGSLRWWYEALVRGLGGYACDPTSEDRCPDRNGNRCAACELFGCTGWARKFRFRVLDQQGQLICSSINKEQELKLEFVELRTLTDEERWLLVTSLKVAANYGAIGGKTTLKPQKKSKAGDDHGIVIFKTGEANYTNGDAIESYLLNPKWRHPKTKLPDLRWFFFIKGAMLWRRQINNVIGLSEDGKNKIEHEEYQKFLRGQRGQGNTPAKSKKIFSFRAGGGRIWGYARGGEMRDKIISQVQKELGDKEYSIKTGEDVIDEL